MKNRREKVVVFDYWADAAERDFCDPFSATGLIVHGARPVLCGRRDDAALPRIDECTQNMRKRLEGEKSCFKSSGTDRVVPRRRSCMAERPAFAGVRESKRRFAICGAL